MKRACTLLLAVLLVLFAQPRSIEGQVTAADSAAVLFDAAAGFEDQGDADVARALYRYILERFGDTPAGRAASERLFGIRSEGTRGSGRVELQVWTTLYGLYLGVAVPGALGADEPEPYGVGLLLGGPVGFFSGRAIARGTDLTEGQARAITMSGSWGIWQALGWRKVFDLGVTKVCEPAPWDPGEEYCWREDEIEEDFAATIVGGIAGMAAGYAIASQPVSPGVATAVNFGALWGTWFGVAGGILMDLEGDHDLLAASLVGGDLGLVATALLSPGWNVSRSRARLVSIAGVIGGISGAGIDLLVQPDDEKVAIGIPLATSIIGLGIGIASTRDYDAGNPVGEDDGPAFGTALVNVRDGHWGVTAPIPYPVMLERKGANGPVPTAGLGVTLFSARFW
jgi:hypothetical protein